MENLLKDQTKTKMIASWSIRWRISCLHRLFKVYSQATRIVEKYRRLRTDRRFPLSARMKVSIQPMVMMTTTSPAKIQNIQMKELGQKKRKWLKGLIAYRMSLSFIRVLRRRECYKKVQIYYKICKNYSTKLLQHISKLFSRFKLINRTNIL